VPLGLELGAAVLLLGPGVGVVVAVDVGVVVGDAVELGVVPGLDVGVDDAVLVGRELGVEVGVPLALDEGAGGRWCRMLRAMEVTVTEVLPWPPRAEASATAWAPRTDAATVTAMAAPGPYRRMPLGRRTCRPDEWRFKMDLLSGSVCVHDRTARRVRGRARRVRAWRHRGTAVEGRRSGRRDRRDRRGPASAGRHRPGSGIRDTGTPMGAGSTDGHGEDGSFFLGRLPG
jgi:hypothetical protein